MTPCIEWQGAKDSRGYGRIMSPRGSTKGTRSWWAHRFAYEMLVGPIPPGLQIDHLCRNTSCINPDHLEPVTHAENVRRGRGGEHHRLKTHCPAGHPYAGTNLYVAPCGNRVCRECSRASKARYKMRIRRLAGESP